MAALKHIRINKALSLLLFKNSFKLNIYSTVAYFPIWTIKEIELNSDLFEHLPKMLEKAYQAGREDKGREIKEQYEEFKRSMENG